MPGYILAIDQGTTGSTAVVLSPEATILGKANREFPQHYPKAGWVEHDLAEIWASVTASIAAALEAASVEPKDCLAIGITNSGWRVGQRKAASVRMRITNCGSSRICFWK